ncbi:MULTISPECIES: type II secretion system F family protein [Nocardiopsis]|uniref:Type II secretion protein F n=1 Tax=Nocardiopsis sinuspersici TaxID=501010 RepID=A0A1V3C5R3_9ACTN|nr:MULTISPECIES: type II secretion system F family protein [Nocardiopsis]OOC56033.1 type II secretion protein F [Nocardiopsis sinuspersici]
MAPVVTALTVCVAALVLLCLVPGTSRNRLETVLVRPRPRFRVRRRVGWRALSARSGEGAGRRRAVVVLCRVLAAELRAGQPPEEALRISVTEAGPPVGAVADAESLRREADRDPDLWALAYLAVCWEVAADTGAGLAEVVDALAENLTAQEEQRTEAAARTSGPRTTAIVLTGLPLAGVLMSSGLGGSPLVFLFTTPLGLACLVSGAALDALGAWWTLRMVRSATAVP